MSAATSLEILQWTGLLALGAGLAACLRTLTLMHDRLDRGDVAARRLRSGDSISLPPSVQAFDDGNPMLLLFVDSACRRCIRSLTQVARAVQRIDHPVRVLLLWVGESSNVEGLELKVDAELAHQRDLSSSLGIGLLPYGVLVAHGSVLGAGAIDSGASGITQILDVVIRETGNGVRHNG